MLRFSANESSDREDVRGDESESDGAVKDGREEELELSGIGGLNGSEEEEEMFNDNEGEDGLEGKVEEEEEEEGFSMLMERVSSGGQLRKEVL